MYEAFIDLDELIVRCRDKQAKKFIKEAVACYKAGAYRSCIVATWNAVVFDFLHKLRELALLGDKEASQLLQQFEKLRTEKKLKELWQFESDIRKKVLKPFELLSIVEMSDIERLFEDRSRCAHPSMTSLEEPFEATAELARYHLRSSVTHLLERPPVQGRAARDRIFEDIKSEYFPTDSELAIKYFEKSPLARARVSLIRDIIVGLTVNLLTENFPEEERMRQFSAIHAISRIYPEKAREILNEKLSDIIISKVTDDNWDKVIIYLGKVSICDNLSEQCQIKAVEFIKKLKIFENKWDYESPHRHDLDILLIATSIGFLTEVIDEIFQLPLAKLLSLKESCEKSSQYHLIQKRIEPLLEKSLPQASLEELISMLSKDNVSLNDKIQPYLVDKIEEASLKEILDASRRIQEEDKLRYNAIEVRLLLLLDTTSLEELLEMLPGHQDNISSKKYLRTLNKMLYDATTKLFEKEKERVENLIRIVAKYQDDELSEKLFKPFLQDNIPKIIKHLKQSYSYDNAASYAKLLDEVANFITATQWQDIIKAFFQNNQISDSRNCASIYESLFNKSIEMDISLKPDWIKFRENLDSLVSDRYINNLKTVIDCHLST
jgi:hypothetical protein